MAFELDQSNTVIAGEFNRAIIRPDWLSKQGIIESDHGAEFLLSDSPASPRRFRVAGLEWEVGFSRLQIRALGQPPSDTGSLAARVLEVLPHTPVAAVGHNFHFVDRTLKNASISFAGVPLKSLADQAQLSSPTEYQWSIASMIDDMRVTVTFISDDHGSKVDFNFHSPAVTADDAARKARSLQLNQDRAQDIVRHISGTSQ